MRQLNSKSTRNSAIVLLYERRPELSMEEIGKLFPNNGKALTKQRVAVILKRHHFTRDCSNCYHQLPANLCACREVGDMVRTPNRCADWTLPERG